MRWLGPGIVIGNEGLGNVWTSHCNAVVKAAVNHVRLGDVEEQLPWNDLYDSLRDTSERAYFDLCPPGASRDPQYERPSTSSDAPERPTTVADESMPDAIAGEPDTSDFPVLPNSSTYAPVRNPRVCWRSDALELPTPQTAAPAVSPKSVPCGAQRATLAFVTTATILADALTKTLVHCPSLLAAMNARRYVFVTSDSSTSVSLYQLSRWQLDLS